MTIAELAELNGLYARWAHREKLKLKWWEVWALAQRMEELGLELP